MSLSNCMRIVNTLHQDDEQALMAHIERLQSEGMPARDAQFAAVHQLMAELESGQAPQLSQRDQVDTPEFKRWFGDWRVELDNTRVNQQLDDWNSGELKSNAVIDLGRPASVLQQFGVPDLPIHMTQRILTKAVLRKHDIDLADLKDFVRNIQAPLAVFGSKLGDGHLVLVTEVRHADGNIIAALDLETTRDGLEINDITSIHPKRDHSVAHWIADGLLRGHEKAKGRTWLENSAGSNPQQPQVKAALDNAIIYETDAIRNPSKVVDAEGKPLVVYHGTPKDFSEFDLDYSTEGAFFFSANPDHAGAFAGDPRYAPASNIMPVYLSLKNPKVLSGKYFGKYHSMEKMESAIQRAKRDGHDGLMIKGLRDADAGFGDTYLAFNPEQIKSAIGNNGQFDPESKDILKSKREMVGKTNRTYTPEQLRAFANVGFEVEVPTLKERIKALWKDAGKKLAQGIADQFAPVKDLDKEAYGLLRLAKGAAGSFETLLKGGMLKLTDGVYDFDRTKRGGVIDRLLIPMQGEHHDFLRWVAANRAERLLAEGKENLFSPQDIADIRTLADGQLAFDYTLQHGPNAGKTTRVRAEMFDDSLKTFNAFNKNVLDMAEQSGLIDGAARHLWEHEFYVPFYRVTDDNGVAGMNIKGGAVRQQAFKKLKGGSNALNADLLDNTLMNWAHLLDASAKNRAAKATLEAAESAGVAIGTNEETARQMGKATGNKNGVVWFMDDGVQHYYLVDDPYILEAITSLEYAGMRNPMMNAMSAVKNALTVGVTASPFFKVRNLIRDSIQVIGTGNIGYNPAKNLKEGWKLTKPENDVYFRLLAGGGTIHFGTMYEGSEAKRVQALVESGVDRSTILDDEGRVKAFYRKFIEPGITAYNELGNRGEAINRAALYNQLVSQGVSHADASLQARDLMDFSMQGTFTTIRFLTQVLPFFNARIQGLYKLGRAAKEDPKRMAYVTGAVAMASLALLAAYGDDDDWKKREDWDRDNYWWFKFGGVAFRIPRPFELGAIGTLAERSAELFMDDEMTGTRFRDRVLSLLGDNLAMNPVPQLVKPMLDVYANKNSFNGRPIETMGMERLQSEYRFNSGTSMTARATSTAMNAVTGLVGKEALSPVQVDSLIRGYFGWLGTFIVGSADIVARYATNEPVRPSTSIWKEVTGGMASELEDAPSRYVSQVYDQAKAIEQAYSTWHALMKEGKTQEAEEFRADNQDQIRRYRNVQMVKGFITKINQQIKVVERSDREPDEKRDEIRRLNQRKDELSRRLAA